MHPTTISHLFLEILHQMQRHRRALVLKRGRIGEFEQRTHERVQMLHFSQQLGALDSCRVGGRMAATCERKIKKRYIRNANISPDWQSKSAIGRLVQLDPSLWYVCGGNMTGGGSDN